MEWRLLSQQTNFVKKLYEHINEWNISGFAYMNKDLWSFFRFPHTFHTFANEAIVFSYYLLSQVPFRLRVCFAMYN